MTGGSHSLMVLVQFRDLSKDSESQFLLRLAESRIPLLPKTLGINSVD
jgi:hypothetical protein